jgi:hypothetical protein
MRPVATAVSRGDSPVVAVLATTRATLDERPHVGTDASDLSTLAGARAGTIGVTLRIGKHKDEHRPLEIKDARGKCCSSQVGEALLPLPRRFGGTVVPVGAVVALTGATTVLADSSTDDPVAGATAPTVGACSMASSVARGDGGRGLHLSGGPPPPPPSLSSSSSSDDKFTGVVGGESPCCSRSRYSSLCCSRCSHRLILLSFAHAARSCSRHCAARAGARAQGVGRSDRAASTVTLC